jgi:ferric-dicitrate binding protein FerR (iron transport regulator)
MAGELGPEVTKVRAALLVKQSDEAGAFVRDIHTLARSLEPPPLGYDSPLPPETVSRITAGAYSKWRRRRVRRFLGSLAVAAGLAIAVFGLRYFHRANSQPELAPGTVCIFSSGYAVGGHDGPRHEALAFDRAFSTNADQYALVRQSHATDCAISASSRCIFKADAVVLENGALAVNSREAVRFAVGSIQGQLDSGRVVLSYEGGRAEVSVYDGSAELSCNGVKQPLHRGQRAVFSGGQLEIINETRPYPSWAARSFDFSAAE